MSFTPTIRDVAQRADVSVSASTVSMVLNGRAKVRPETYQRISSAMNQLGYMPNRSGRSAIIAKSKKIAVHYSPWSLRHGELPRISREWISGIKSATSPSGTQINLLAGAEHIAQDLMFKHMINNCEIDGIVFIGPLSQHGYLQWTLRQRIPTVVMNQKPRFSEFSAVSIDHSKNITIAMEHLASLGHRASPQPGPRAPAKKIPCKNYKLNSSV